MPIKRLAWLAVAVCLAVPPIVHAQKGKGPKPEPVDTPGVAWLITDDPADDRVWVEDLTAPQTDPENVDWDIAEEGKICENAPSWPFPGGIYGDGNA